MINYFNRPTNDQGGADSSGHRSSAPHQHHGADTGQGTPRPDAAPPKRIRACGHVLPVSGTSGINIHVHIHSAKLNDGQRSSTYHTSSYNQSRAWGPLPGATYFTVLSGRGCGVVHVQMSIVRRPPHHHNQRLQSLYQQASGVGASVYSLFVVLVQSGHTQAPHV